MRGTIDLRDAGHGYDVFGMRPSWVKRSARLLEPLYRHYFRVQSTGADHIPVRGAAILAANHGGMLPLDGAMLYLDVLHHTDPPRVPRPIADLFVPDLPFIGTLFARAGTVAGSRRNAHRLLEAGELLLCFPEGTAGIGKPWRQRNQLQAWRVGHAELAIRHRAPVVPVALIGPDEQWLQLARLPIHLFGAPYLPVPLNLLPLPVRYHIRYGEPLALHEGLAPTDADDPEVVAAAADRVAGAVEELLVTSLAERAGLFT